MAIVVQCPKCQAKLRGPDDLAGKSVRCKGCQEKFRVLGGQASAESLSDTQQLSVVGSAMVMPVVTVSPTAKPTDAPAFVPQPVALASTPEEPLLLDDLILEEAPKPALALPAKGTTLDAADLIEEPKLAADPFSFEEPAPEAVKKKRRVEDEDDDRPRKKRRAEQEDEDGPSRKRRRNTDDEIEQPEKKGYQKQAGKPWGILIGVGVAVLVIGGGITALLLVGEKKEEAKAKVVEQPKLEPKSKTKNKGKETKGTEPPPDDGEPKNPGGTKPPDGPMPPLPPKKEPPKKEPPPPPASPVKLPESPTGNLTVAARVKHRAALDFPAEKVRAVRAAGASLVVVFNSQMGFQGAGVKDTIRKYDIASGNKANRQFEFDSSGLTWPRAFAVSQTDGLVAVESGGAGKVTAYDFETGGTVFEKLDVFADTAGRVGPIAALILGANRKLFVVDQVGTVDVWDMSTRVRTVAGTPPKRAVGITGKPAKAHALAGGNAVALVLDGKVWAVNTEGATIGKPVNLPDPSAVVLAIGASSGTDRVAVAYQTAAGKYGIAAVHTTNGTIEGNVILPEGSKAPTSLSWAADTLISVATNNGEAGLIVDLERKLATGYLKGATAKTTLQTVGDEFWWLAPESADPQKALLLSVDLPFDGYFELAGKATTDRQPVYLVPRADGLAR